MGIIYTSLRFSLIKSRLKNPVRRYGENKGELAKSERGRKLLNFIDKMLTY